MAGNEKKKNQPVYMISVAAKLTGMHPQTLRIYERKNLVSPERTARSTRLYSEADIEQLLYIQRLTRDEGVNLAGVKIIIELQRRLEKLNRRLAERERRLAAGKKRHEEEIKRLRLRRRQELVLIPRGEIVKISRS